MRILRRKPLPQTVCVQCNVFRESKDVAKTNEKNKTILQRYCRVKRKFVANNDPACRAFDRVKFFWCLKFGHQITHTVCYYRRHVWPTMEKFKSLASPCKRCQQYGREIKDIITNEEHEYINEKSGIKIKRRRPPLKRRATLAIKRKPTAQKIRRRNGGTKIRRR